MANTPRTPTGSGDDPATDGAQGVDGARPGSPDGPAAPSRGWDRQPQAAYDAGDSGGWGGPHPNPMTGPIPRIRRDAPPAAPPREGDTPGSSADERQHGRQPTAPTTAAPGLLDRSPAAAPEPPSAPRPETGHGNTGHGHGGHGTTEPRITGQQNAARDTAPHHAARDTRRHQQEPLTADLPVQPDPGAPLTRGAFSRYVLPQLLPVTFWLFIAYLLVEGVTTIALATNSGVTGSEVLGVSLLVGFKIVALGCVARVVLEACDRAFHR